MSIAVCLPICGESFEDSQKIIEAESQSFDYFELWLDYLNDCEVGKLQHLVTQYPDRILLLFRRKGLEPPLMKSERKKEIIEGLRKFPCIFDFDISVQRADLEFYANMKPATSRLITSYHNYAATPEGDDFERILQEMLEFEPDFVKFATHCNSMQDALNLMGWLLRLEKVSPAPIVLGMGECGILTRCFGGEFGNTMTFVVRESGEQLTAAGQISRTDLRRIEADIQRIKDGWQ